MLGKEAGTSCEPITKFVAPLQDTVLVAVKNRQSSSSTCHVTTT